MNKIYKDNDLEKSDVYKDKRGFSIITRSGIEKIQARNEIAVSFEVVKAELDNCIIKATSLIKDGDDWIPKMETFGSATKDNCRQPFRIEIAEKRALARVIIKTMNYTETLGEDEIKHQSKVINK
ncbi:MAG: hypothetical protein H8E84_00570 [Flavobacteriales bacterium]|nr:hypothetical protein [Flavobacteriales bacterium]